MNNEKLLSKIKSNRKNVKFSDFVKLVVAFGFRISRVNGSHHIFVHKKIGAIINLQNVKGEAKPYQIKQFLDIIEANNLKLKEDK